MRTIKVKENIIYAILWIVVLIGYVLHFSVDHSSSVDALPLSIALINAFYTILPLFMLFLLNNFVLIPRLIKGHGILIYVFSIVGILAVCGIWEYATFIQTPPHALCPSGHPGSELPPHSAMNRPPHNFAGIPIPFIHNMFYAILVVGINLAISILGRYVKLNIEKKNLEAANVQGQLDQLKGQINPHFYMNMLNSIHGLIVINPSKAQELVMELSRLMRYMLYDSSRDYIPLSKELTFLKEYIRIIHERYPDEKVKVTTKFPSDAEIEGIVIPPLLFIVFIENAFKYGVDYRYKSEIVITIEIAGEKLIFGCMNFVHPKENDHRLDRGGIGLANIKKRLNLLYGHKAQLNITDTDDQFIVTLKIPVNETYSKDTHN